jgi:hypothetical protein
MIPITRLYSDTNGDTHFEDIEIETKDEGIIGFLSENIPVKEVVFREVVPSYDYDFHNTPQRQYLVLLNGLIEIETSLGVKRQFGAGDVMLLEDTTGKGHKSRNLTQVRRKSIFIILP